MYTERTLTTTSTALGRYARMRTHRDMYTCKHTSHRSVWNTNEKKKKECLLLTQHFYFENTINVSRWGFSCLSTQVFKEQMSWLPVVKVKQAMKSNSLLTDRWAPSPPCSHSASFPCPTGNGGTTEFLYLGRIRKLAPNKPINDLAQPPQPIS